MNIKAFIQVVFVMLMLNGCCSFDKWTREDKILQSIQLGFHSIDWLQTMEIVNEPDYYESNAWIGKHPTKSDINRYMLATAVMTVLITHTLPQEHRKYWLMFRIGVSSSAAVQNYNVGIKVSEIASNRSKDARITYIY